MNDRSEVWISFPWSENGILNPQTFHNAFKSTGTKQKRLFGKSHIKTVALNNEIRLLHSSYSREQVMTVQKKKVYY